MSKRARTEAQIAAEARRDEKSKVTLVRHTDDSFAAMKALRRKHPTFSDPEIMRHAIIEMSSTRKGAR